MCNHRFQTWVTKEVNVAKLVCADCGAEIGSQAIFAPVEGIIDTKPPDLGISVVESVVVKDTGPGQLKG
jgi:hypothetical protein